MIKKILTQNDTGETGAHQAGMHVPKREDILIFFPTLNSSIKNPRSILHLVDDCGIKWLFNFIYYNNKFFGGTRNEYRLTGMTGFIKKKNLKSGDAILLAKQGNNYTINFERKNPKTPNAPLKLSESWISIKLK